MFCRSCGKELDDKAELCPECGIKPLQGGKFCNNCGLETKPEAEFCVKCGGKLAKAESAEFSGEPRPEPVGEVSGKPEPETDVGEVPGKPAPEVRAPETPEKPSLKVGGEVSEKSRLAASLLALFLGQFGIHRFYLGKIGTAVVMLILGILGWATVWILIGLIFLVPVGIWALVDFILAVAGLMKDKEGKPIKNW